MKFSILVLAAMLGSFAEGHKVNYVEPSKTAANEDPNDLYSFTDRDNVNKEIEQAQEFMKVQKIKDAEAAKQKKINDAYAKIEKEKADKVKAENARVQNIMSLAEKVDEYY